MTGARNTLTQNNNSLTFTTTTVVITSRITTTSTSTTTTTTTTISSTTTKTTPQKMTSLILVPTNPPLTTTPISSTKLFKTSPSNLTSLIASTTEAKLELSSPLSVIDLNGYMTDDMNGAQKVNQPIFVETSTKNIESSQLTETTQLATGSKNEFRFILEFCRFILVNIKMLTLRCFKCNSVHERCRCPGKSIIEQKEVSQAISRKKTY